MPENIVTLNPLYRGDSREYTLSFTKNDGTKIDISGWKIYFTLKKYAWKADADADLKKDITDHSNPLEGKTKITLTAGDTENLGMGVYSFDIQIKKADGTILTILKGKLEILLDITRRRD
ncbi:hypothetical protein ES705_38862 [subsurface metagenome]